MVKESQSFDLKYEEVVLVCAAGLLRLHGLDRCRQDGPLKLQDSIAHIHFAQVAKVMSARISVGCQRGPQFRLQGVTSVFITQPLHPPLCSVCHQRHIQGSSGEVVPVRAGLTVKACAEALCYWCPVQDPDVLREDSVQHLHIWKLRASCFILGANINIFGECDSQSSTKLCGTQIYGNDLWRRDKCCEKENGDEGHQIVFIVECNKLHVASQ